MQQIIANLINGVSFGMILFLISAGLSIVMGLMGVVNMAHGVLYMLGAYMGWTIAVKFGLSFWLAVICGSVFSAFVGLLLERFFIRHLYNKPNEQVMVTYGFVYIITNLTMWVWGARSRLAFTAPSLRATVLRIGDFPIPKDRLLIIGVGALIATLLLFIQNRTKVGAIVRAGMDDREMISGLGVNVDLLFAGVFGFASLLAGFAGVIGAQVLGANITMGTDIFLYALIVVVVGGLGSLQGSLCAGLLIGLVDTYGKAYLPQLAMFTIYLLMVAILLFKPSGLMGRKL